MDLKTFIHDNKSLINNQDFNKVFEHIRYADLAAQLIHLLKAHNINPVEVAFQKDSKANWFLLNVYLRSNSISKFVVPSNVTEIESRSFDNVSTLKSLDLSDTQIELLKTGTVRNCYNLEEIWLPNTLKKVESEAVIGNKLSFQTLVKL